MWARAKMNALIVALFAIISSTVIVDAQSTRKLVCVYNSTSFNREGQYWRYIFVSFSQNSNKSWVRKNLFIAFITFIFAFCNKTFLNNNETVTCIICYLWYNFYRISISNQRLSSKRFEIIRLALLDFEIIYPISQTMFVF